MIISQNIRSLPVWVNSLLYTSKLKTISGKVTKLSIDFPCRVRLFERQTGTFLKEVLTDANGNYHFDNISSNFEYTIVAHDHQRQFNAVIQDMVRPV